MNIVDQYDSIIIGAGHNGLVCAAYLARSGQSVLVLEASDRPGGLAAEREFHPDFRTSVAHSVSHFSRKVADDLKLSSFGFQEQSTSLPTIGLSIDNRHVVVNNSSLSGTGSEDADAYRAYSGLMHRFADVLKPFWLKTMPRIGSAGMSDLLTFGHLGLNIRTLGKKDMREFMRIATLPARDLVDEYFDNDLLKATLCWDGLIGSNRAPRSPNGAVLAMLYRMTGECRGMHSIPAGGIKGLIDALSAAAVAAGAEIRCSAAVGRVQIEGSADGLLATGVQLTNGNKIAADRVISATDPRRTFLDMVGVEHLEIGFTNRIQRLRCAGHVAKLHLALDGVPEFNGLEAADGRMIIAPDMDTIEFAFDAAKHGECPTQPVMEIVVPSLHETSLAPAGKHVLSAHVMYVPHRLKGGWTDAARALITERAIDTIAQYAPRVREQIIHRELLTPEDLEKNYRVTGGHWHHAEFAIDQMLMMRPTYEAAQYTTPIPGLFLCAAGSHPGGDLTGAAGHNAAQEILR
jgi:phytoene dehydrogenase-like protein